MHIESEGLVAEGSSLKWLFRAAKFPSVKF
jgi:hypothetical protein